MITLPERLLSVSSINMLNWQEKKNKLKQKFPHLSEPDLNFEEGNVESMIDNLHSKIGMAPGNTKEGLYKYIEML
jgi:hypothetical protein